MAKKKNPTLGSYVKSFLDDTGLSDALQETAGRVVRNAINALEREEEEVLDQDNPYVILGLHPEAPTEVVEAAYRALAKKNHPDLGGDEEKFKRISKAYQEIRIRS